MLKPVQLGSSGLRASQLCLGTMNFGWHTSEKDSFRIMDRALELGINFFDTADVYGWTVEHGHTEEIIGRWLAQGGGREAPGRHEPEVPVPRVVHQDEVGGLFGIPAHRGDAHL